MDQRAVTACELGDSSRTERNYVIHFFTLLFPLFQKKRQRCAILHCGQGLYPCRAYVISVGNTTSQMFFHTVGPAASSVTAAAAAAPAIWCVPVHERFQMTSLTLIAMLLSLQCSKSAITALLCTGISLIRNLGQKYIHTLSSKHDGRWHIGPVFTNSYIMHEAYLFFFIYPII